MSFPALVIGSLSPDLGYLSAKLPLDDTSHHLIGIVVFCLPVSLLILWLIYGLGGRLLPESQGRFGRIFSSLLKPGLAPLGILVISTMIGAMTHLVWDGFTHKDGWFVARWPLLQMTLGMVAKHQFKVCHLLWYTSTFLGIAWLGVAYQDWREAATQALIPASSRAKLAKGVLLAGLALPVAIAHHWLRGSPGNWTVLSFLLIVLPLFAWWIERGEELRNRSAREPELAHTGSTSI